MEIDPSQEGSSSSGGSYPSIRATPQEETTGSKDEGYLPLIDVLTEEGETSRRRAMAVLQGISHSAEETSDMTREELKAHLDANQARVEQMTQGVGNKIDRLDDRMGHIEDNQSDLKKDLRSTRSTMVLGFIGLAALVVAMLVYGYQRIDTLGNRIFENTQRIEQVAPQPQGTGGADQSGSTSEDSAP